MDAPTFGVLAKGNFFGALPFAIYALKGTSSQLVQKKMVMFMGGSRMRGLGTSEDLAFWGNVVGGESDFILD